MKIDKSTFESHLHFLDEGAVVFRENDPGGEMYVIIQGEVEIRKATGPSSNKTLTVLKKGDLFGEMAIIDKKPRSATAVATQPSKLLVLNEKLYESMVASNPDFARKMNRLLSERVRKANAIIQSLMTTNRQNQLWAGLLQYAQERGVSTFKGSRVTVLEFVQWASEHLGMAEKDVQAILAHLIKREFISYSARGKEEILVEAKEGVPLPD
jgi:CRP/FNR family cyclic AMP-dependent transcriptional regulator